MSTEIETAKPWWQSKTVWGGAIAVAAGVAGAFGFSIGPDEQEALAAAIVGVASGVGGLLSIYGRIKANKAIK